MSRAALEPAALHAVERELARKPLRWLVTGAAGFIGSHLLERLLRLDQTVVGLDDFSSGKRENLDDVRSRVAADQWARFALIEGDIKNPETCRQAVAGADRVLHQAAIGSVPRSVRDPWSSHDANVNGTLRIFLAAKEAGVPRIVYASSSSVYGDSAELPKIEERTGNPLSPYALTKVIDEAYAAVFARTYGMETIGLRYFNVFGARQDPNGMYAAVIPRWIGNLIHDRKCEIFGDGTQSRDFCFVDNVVQINLLAAMTKNTAALNQAYNVGVGGRTDLKTLFETIRQGLLPHYPHLKDARPEFRAPREGDIPHSQADITKARTFLGYSPEFDFQAGIAHALDWYRENLG